MTIRFDVTAESLLASRFISAAQSRFAVSAERLSTGLRITHASADAAGASLATKLQAQTLGWNRAQQNIQDGFSLAQVADTTFATLNDLVGRIRELAVQSANGVYSDAERAMLQTEVDALRSEIGQVVARTTFNGVSLMEGVKYQPPPNVDVDGAVNGTLNGVVTFDGVTLTAGGADPYLTGALEGAATAYGTESTKSGTYEVVIISAPVQAELVGGIIAANLPAGAGPAISVTLTGSGGTAVATLDRGDATGAWLGKLNAAGAGIGVVATLENYYGTGFNYLVLRSATGGSTQSVRVTATAIDPLVAPEDYLGIGPGTLSDSGEDLAATVNGAAATVGSSATAVTLRVNSPGNDAHGLVVSVNNSPLDPFYNGPFPLGGSSAGFVNVERLPEETLDLQLGIQAGPNVENQQILTIKPMTTGAMGLTGSGDLGAIDISTQSGALDALDITDDAHEQIGGARATLGATWNALQQALSIAGVGEDEAQAADSRISDVDVATESTELIKAQLQTQGASAAMAHMHADAARTLQLISEAEVQLQIVSPEAPLSAEGGGSLAPPPPPAATGGALSGPALAAPSGFSGSTFAAPSAFSGSALAGAAGFDAGSLGGYTPQPVTPGYNAYSATPGFDPVAVTPGYTPLPVLGSKSAAEVAAQISGLSSAQMFSMIAGGIAA